MWAELTEVQTGSRVMINFDYVESYVEAGTETQIVFGGTSYLVKESYEDIKKILSFKREVKHLGEMLRRE